MTRKSWLLLSFAIVLGGIYLYTFTDFIHPPRIQIIKSDRVLRQVRPGQTVYPVAFAFDGKYRLTMIRVFSANEYAVMRNRSHPLWALNAKKDGPPVKGFIYGNPVPGMQSATTNRGAQSLEAGTTYHLLVQAGRALGELDFQPAAVTAAGE